MTLDVETVNAILKVIDDMMHEYLPTSPEGFVLYQLMERIRAL